MGSTPGIPGKEAPELTAEQASALHSGDVLVRSPRKRGRSKGSGTKEPVNLRLDRDIPAYYRALGAGWQGRINATLRRSLPKRNRNSMAARG
jgi:uncharacterized protein (DUF4415 family)